MDPENIFAAVSQLGIGGAAPSLDEEFRGGQCRVYKLSFQARESLAVRVPLYISAGSPDEIIGALSTEWTTLQTLEAKGFRWAPRCHGRSLTFDNPVKHPFLVLAWVEGSKLGWDEDFPPRPLRDTLLGQMAAIQMSLIECTLENGSTTATGFFERIIENRRTRVREGKVPGLSEQDCVDQKALLPWVLGRRGCDKMVAMDHGDFKPDNIIVDAEYNIKCVIDWAFAGTVPLPRAAGPPRFLWGPFPSPTAWKDKQSYVASFASRDSQEASYMRLFQTARDVDFRTLYVESLFSKGVQVLLAAKGWKLPDCELLEDEDEEEPSLGDDSENGGEAAPVRDLQGRGLGREQVIEASIARV